MKLPTEKNLAEIDQNLGKAKIQKNNSSKNIFKGIEECYNPECKSKNIIYDEPIDEIYCFDCGYVLRQGLTDYKYLFEDECVDDWLDLRKKI